MARCLGRTSADPSAIGMSGMIQTIRFTMLGLLIAVLVVGSGAHGTNTGAGSLAYSSASASANAYASAGSIASAFSNADAFAGVGNFPGLADGHNGHKGIRSYDEPGHGGNGQPNGWVKGNGEKRCSKCKWEDDDYWEKEETETEPEEKDESDCEDGDDGQYREEHHGPGQRHKVGSSPSLQKFQAPYPTGVGSSTGTGGSANAAAIAGSSGPFGVAPVKGGYHTGSSASTSGSPWNKVAPGLAGNKHEPGRPSNQQPDSAWNVDLGIASGPSWSQGHDNSRPAIVSQPSDAWHTGPVASSNGGTASQFAGTWDKRPETGSGCSGSYQSGTGCAQGSSGPGSGSVQKQGTPDYSSTGYNPAGPLGGCSGGANSNCPGNPGETGPYATRGPIQSSPSQGHYPGSESTQTNSGANAGPRDERPAISGNRGTPGIFGNFGPSGNAASSGTANAGTGSSFGDEAGYDSNHPENGAHAPSPYSHGTQFNGSPFANSGNRNPTYPGVKAGVSGDANPGSGSGAHPTGSASGSEPDSGADGHAASGAAANAGSSSRQGRPDNGDSKIFYINVSPAPGSRAGVKPHSTTKSPHSGIGTTEFPQQPKPHAGFGPTSPPYQQGPHAGPGTTKPSRQPGPYGDDSIANPSPQPSPYGGGSTTKPSHQTSPYGGVGATKPFNGNSGWPKPMTTNAQAPVSATSGCSNGHGDCGIGSGCSSSNSKSCDQPGHPGGIGKTPEQPGGPEKYPAGFPENSPSVYPGTGSTSFGGIPTGNKNGGPGCTGSIGCSPGPAYVDKSEPTNTHPGGGKPYPWNPFLTGELPSSGAGGIYTTPASKPIGHGNPFLEGAAAGAGANVGTRPGGSDQNVEEPAKPIGQGNPFLAGPAHTRGDIGIGGETGPIFGGPGVSSTSNNGPSRATNTVPSFGDKTAAGFGGPSNHHLPGLGWSSEPSQASFPGVKNPSATHRGSGSGGGVGVGPEGLPNFQTGHPDGNSFGGASSGAFSSSQASSYANSRSNSHSGSAVPAATFGQANSGNWAPSGANAGSLAGSGSWSSSGASAYASSSANSWSGTGPGSVKG